MQSLHRPRPVAPFVALVQQTGARQVLCCSDTVLYFANGDLYLEKVSAGDLAVRAHANAAEQAAFVVVCFSPKVFSRDCLTVYSPHFSQILLAQLSNNRRATQC
jgi:hypothetical protein